MAENTLKLKYEIGNIKFEAEGPSSIVENQRLSFINDVLPAAVEAMKKTASSSATAPLTALSPAAPSGLLPPNQNDNTSLLGGDLSRTSLPSFLKDRGFLSDTDFTLHAAYFDEMQNGTRCFSIEEVKKYFSDARRPLPKNPSAILNRLASRGYIMDAEKPSEGNSAIKYYKLSTSGIDYVSTYTPKEGTSEKHTKKASKSAVKSVSQFATLTADDLNLSNYPKVNSFKNVKEQVLLAMYIITNEGKGEWFSLVDIVYLLNNVFDLPANENSIRSVFNRNKSFFKPQQDPDNNTLIQRRLLTGGKEFVENLIAPKGK